MKVSNTLFILLIALDPINSLTRFKKEEDNASPDSRFLWMNQLRSIIGVQELHTANIALIYESSSKNSSYEVPINLEPPPVSPVATFTNLFYPMSSLFRFVAHFRRQWVHRVARHVLIIEPSKSILHGIVAAAANVVRGYFSAVHIAISYPWEHDEAVPTQHNSSGTITFLKDSMVGVFSGILMISTAFASGIYQIYTGFEGTWEGIQATIHGKIWDDRKGRYDFYSLDQDAIQTERLIQSINTSQHSKSSRIYSLGRRRKYVKDSSFYKLLQVPMDASTHEIRQAYYRKAVQIHPDKNPTDDHAATKFQITSSVYQTLVDEDSRRAYDTYGVCYRQHYDRLPKVPQMNPSIFLTLLFGSDVVRPYVGELSIVSMVDQIFSLGEDESQTLMHIRNNLSWTQKQTNSIHSLQQRQRQIQIAQYLRNKHNLFFGKFDHNNVERFRSHCSAEAAKIRKSDFGDVFLSILGRALLRSSEQYLGYNNSFLGLRGIAHYLKNSASYLYEHVVTTFQIGKAVQVSIQAYLDSRGEPRSERKSTIDTIMDDPFQDIKCKSDSIEEKKDFETMWRKLESSLPTILELGWAVNNRDIVYTLHEACNKLFYDASVSWEQRQHRALAMKILGEEFLKFSLRKDTIQENQNTWRDMSSLKEKIEYALLSSISLDDDE